MFIRCIAPPTRRRSQRQKSELPPVGTLSASTSPMFHHSLRLGCRVSKMENFEIPRSELRPDARVPITAQTLETIKNEVLLSVQLPASIFNVCMSLAENKMVMTMHRHDQQPTTTSKDETTFAPSVTTNEEEAPSWLTLTTPGNHFKASIHDPPRDMSLLVAKFGALDMETISSSRKPEANSEEENSDLKLALIHLGRNVGATTLKLHDWEEAKKCLSEVLILPSDSKTPNNESDVGTTKHPISANVALQPFQRKYSGRKLSAKTPALMQKPLFKKTHSPGKVLVNKTSSYQSYVEMLHKRYQELGRQSSATASWTQVHWYPRTSVASNFSPAEMKSAEALDKCNALKLQQHYETQKEIESRLKKKEEVQVLPPLTPSEAKIVKDILFGRPPGSSDSDIIATIDTDSIQRGSIRKLQPGQWLNDEVIHFYLTLLAHRDADLTQKDPARKRTHFFKSFFITKLLDDDREYSYKNVRRWSKKVPGQDIFALDKIICPVNLGNTHWCCAVIFMNHRKIQFYDSMGGSGRHYLHGLFKYIQDEHQEKKKKPLLDKDEWSLVECQPDTPQQLNHYDCGVFTCAFADFLSRDAPLNFSQVHITALRERIALAIVKKDASF